jgi:hypothetical protein
MLNLILAKIETNDLSQILKCLVYSMYREKQLSQSNLNYINYLINLFSLEDETEMIFNIDTRYELPFEEIMSKMNQNGARALLLIFIITSEIFKDSNLEKYLKIHIYKFLPFDDSIKKEISKLSCSFLSLSVEIYNNIFNLKDSSFFSLKSKENIEDYQKLFLITKNELDSISKEEKESFIKILVFLMYDDNIIDELELNYLNLWFNIFSLEQINIEDANIYNNLSISVLNEVKTAWFAKFLVFAFLLTQETVNTDSNNKFYRIKKLNIIEEKFFDDLLNIVNRYKETKINLTKVINSNIITVKDESNAKYAQIGLNIAEIALSCLPVIGNINAIRRISSHVVDNRNIMDFGLTDINKNSNSNQIIICIDGFMSESGHEQFSDWSLGLQSLKSNSWLQGYKWASNNIKTVLTGGVSSWYESVGNSEKASLSLVRDIGLIYSFKPDAEIILMGHSLGARVIFNALKNLQKTNLRIQEVYLFGGAVSRNDKAGWLSALTTVDKKIYNFYSFNDSVLKNLYQSTMIGDNPIGLGEIEFYNSADLKLAEVENIDVTHIIGGHTEYKNKIQSLISIIK